MTPAKTAKSRKGFDELRKQIDADPIRRAKIDEHKTTMLSELRRKLDLTQAIVADRLDVTQENVKLGDEQQVRQRSRRHVHL
jgi:DNA-binding transcriptional regulator YiaG